jgi:uncharacterized membrane protein YgcG
LRLPERKVRIEVGYGLEGDLTDAMSTQIIHNRILPAFRNGTSTPACAGSMASSRRSAARSTAARAMPNPRDRRPNARCPAAFFWLIVLLILFSSGRRRGGGGLTRVVLGQRAERYVHRVAVAAVVDSVAAVDLAVAAAVADFAAAAAASAVAAHPAAGDWRRAVL